MPQSETQQKILVVMLGDFSFINHMVREQITDKFPEYTVEIADPTHIFNKLKYPLNFARNTVAFLKLYGGGRRGWVSFVSTPYANQKIKKWIQHKVATGNYRFTFQTQSVYDASTNRVPHFVYTDHTALANLYYPGFDRKGLRPPTFLQMEHNIYRNADLVFTFSSHVSRSLIDLYHCSPEKVIRVGAGTNVKADDMSVDVAKYHNKNILFVGVDWIRKGGPHLVASFAKVREKHPDATLTIVGCSPDISQPGVQIVGRVPQDEVGRYYDKASIFCMPTTREPFGIVFIEALYKRLPIVATNIGAIPDLVVHGENGYMVTNGDVEALAKYLIMLLDDPEKCRQFGDAGYSRAKAEYGWDLVGERFRQHIDSYISGK